MFAFFYSGHGGQVERFWTSDPRDPYGLDEIIELYDAAVLDNDLAAMFEPICAGKTLVIPDSCLSGGFSKDFLSKPGRMGPFSSEEDVVSEVGTDHGAGGSLSLFFGEGVGQSLADLNLDGDITAIELSQYIHERYPDDVDGFGIPNRINDDISDSPFLGYQHLVVDRIGNGPHDVLLRITR